MIINNVRSKVGFTLVFLAHLRSPPTLEQSIQQCFEDFRPPIDYCLLTRSVSVRNSRTLFAKKLTLDSKSERAAPDLVDIGKNRDPYQFGNRTAG